MGDLSQYSDEELRALMKQARTQENATAATHFGEGGGSGTGFKEDFGLTSGEMFRAGIGRGIVSIGRNAANLATWATNPVQGPLSDLQLKDANELDRALLADRTGSTGNLIGQAAAVTPFAMVAGAAAPGAISQGAIEGATQGLLSAEPASRLKNTALGAGMGAAIPAIGSGARKLAYGMNVTPEARMLRSMGVDLTPGQMNPEGAMNTLEQAWESVPVVGNVVKGARGSAEGQFQQRVLQQAGAPGASVSAGDTLAETLDNAYQSFDPAYDAVRNFPATGTRSGIAKGLAQTTQDASVLADQNARDTVANWLRNKATQLPQSGPLDTGDLLDLRSAIRTKIRGVSDDAQLDLLNNAEQKLTAHLNALLPPDAASALAATDRQYAKYKILEDALRKAKDRPDGFTPSQLSQAIQQATDPGTYARGGGLMRDLSSAGASTFRTTMPNTGGRNAAIALSAASAPVSIPLGLGAVGTQTGRALMAGETAPQQLMQSLISGGSRALSPSQRRLLSEALQRMAVAPAVQSAGTGAP